MEKAYEKIVFVNDQAPDLDADNLNSISDAIDTIDDRVVAHDTSIASKADKTYTDTELAKKSDKSYVDTELAKKADKTYVDTELDKKTSKTYVDDALALKANSTNPSTSGSFNHNGNIYADDFYYFDGSDGALDGGGLIISTQTSVKDAIDGLDTRISTNTTNISQNTADITALKNKPSGITLTSASPLNNSTASAIVGIDVDGCSTQTISANLANFIGNGIINGSGGISNSDSAVYSDYIAVSSGSYTLSANTSMATLCIATYDSSKTFITRLMKTNSQSYTITLDSNAKYVRVYFAMSSAMAYATAITTYKPMFNSGSSALPYEAYTGTPTPTNPIAIVDANTDVVAHTVNLFNLTSASSSSATLSNGVISLTWSSGYESYLSNEINVDSNKTYTISFKAKGNAIKFKSNGATVVTTTNTTDFTLYSVQVSNVSNIALSIARQDASGSAQVKDIQVEQGTTASDYVAYASNKITLPTLRSVGTVKDELIVNADGSGQIIRRVGVLNLKNCTFEYYGEYNNGYLFYYDAIADAKRVDTAILSMCEYFTCVPNSQWSSMSSGQYRVKTDDGRIYANSADKTTKAQFNSWLQGLDHCYLYYVKATPTTETLTSSQVASIRQLQTYNGTTIIDSALEVKSVSYNADTKKYIDDKFVYSTEETLIGYWTDGKPLYRQVLFGATTSSSSGGIVKSFYCADKSVKKFDGVINVVSTNKVVPINFYYPNSLFAYTYMTNGGIFCRTSSDLYYQPIEIVIEYTYKDTEDSVSVLSDEEAEG